MKLGRYISEVTTHLVDFGLFLLVKKVDYCDSPRQARYTSSNNPSDRIESLEVARKYVIVAISYTALLDEPLANVVEHHHSNCKHKKQNYYFF